MAAGMFSSRRKQPASGWVRRIAILVAARRRTRLDNIGRCDNRRRIRDRSNTSETVPSRRGRAARNAKNATNLRRGAQSKSRPPRRYCGGVVDMSRGGAAREGYAAEIWDRFRQSSQRLGFASDALGLILA